MEQITLLAAVAAVLVLQLITILLIIGKKKPGRDSGDVRRHGAEFRGEKKDSDPRRGNNSGGRKPGENRGGGGGNRPQQQNKPPQNQPAVIDPMEKSLRDINLRLKNAEREQENARKKFQESGVGSAGGRDNRDGRPPHQRNDRGGGGNRGGGGGNRDFNRDRPPRVDNRPEKPYRSEQENPAFSGAGTESEQPIITPAAPEIPVNDVGVSEDQLQHGRRFTAKRRQLPSDPAPETIAPDTDTPITAPQTAENEQDIQTQQQDETTDIQFGRR
jgi:hypothetical protein